MKLKERIYREILMGILEGKRRFTQLETSKNCRVSLGLVNKTAKELAEIGGLSA